MTTLNCPTCCTELSRTSMAGQIVDRCTRCGGIWFDASELAAALDSHNPGHKNCAPANSAKKIICPVCTTDIPSTDYAHDSGIPINKCVTCNGIWLEEGQFDRVASYRHGPHPTDGLADAMAANFGATQRWRNIAGMIQSRFLSSLVATALLLIVLMATGDWRIVLRLFEFLILPLACIWFGEAMGSLTGIRLGLFRPQISDKTPGIAVAMGGWGMMIAAFFVTIYRMS